MTTLELFAYQDMAVRVITIDGEPWFVLADLCKVLDLSSPSMVAQRLDPVNLSQAEVENSRGQMRQALLVSEAGMYEVVIRSDKPEAVAFRRWITSEVLPAIRKTGSYGVQQLTGPELMARAVLEATKTIKALEARTNELAAKVEADAPKVIFADAVAVSDGTCLVRELATILKGNGIEIGATRLFKELRDAGYLVRRAGSDFNTPTQKSMELGLFRVKETAVTHSDGRVTIRRTPKVTGKGQQYFVERYLTGALPKRNKEIAA